MSYTKNDFFILDSIYKGGGTSSLRALPVKTITLKTNLSHTKIRATIKMLLSINLLQEGYMQNNAKTYFITKDGIKFLEDMKKEC